MTILDFMLLAVELGLYNGEVPLELLVEAAESRILQGYQLVNVDQVVPQGHLMLLLRLVQVTVNHLQNGVLGVHFSVMVLLIDLHFLLELFGFGNSHDLTPVSKDLHSVKVCHLLFLIHCVLQIVPAHLHLFLFLIKILDTLVLMSDLDKCTLLVGGRRGLALHELS